MGITKYSSLPPKPCHHLRKNRIFKGLFLRAIIFKSLFRCLFHAIHKDQYVLLSHEYILVFKTNHLQGKQYLATVINRSHGYLLSLVYPLPLHATPNKILQPPR